MRQFITKHQRDVAGVLSGFDRVRFRGTIRMLAYAGGLLGWLNERRVMLKDFREFAIGLTKGVAQSVREAAAAAGKTVRYIASSQLSKEDLVRELLRREGLSEGLVCVLSCVEPCRSFDIRRDALAKWIEPVPAPRKCLHWYFYFLDRALGLCHVRIQSWLPFAVHACVNGREWLCRSLAAAGIGFERRDNCLARVADVPAAQALLDAQAWADWSGMLNGLLERSCPALLRLPLAGRHHEYYWSADETEWATDVMFRSPEALAALYPSLLRHGITTFGSADVMRFLGRKQFAAGGGVPARFSGEVVSDLRTRPEGVRIKHRLNANSIKMYDKQGSVLRVETTINDPHDFLVHRASETDPNGPRTHRVLRKGVADLPRRAEISQASNRRYLDALASVEADTPLSRILDDLSQPRTTNGHRSRGLHPLAGDDARLIEILLRGEFAINGFRNRDLRERLFPPTTDAGEIRRQSGQVGRRLRLFRDHGLIYRVRGTHRYHLTAEGRRTLPAFPAARSSSAQKLAELAA